MKSAKEKFQEMHNHNKEMGADQYQHIMQDHIVMSGEMQGITISHWSQLEENSLMIIGNSCSIRVRISNIRLQGRPLRGLNRNLNFLLIVVIRQPESALHRIVLKRIETMSKFKRECITDESRTYRAKI